MDLKDFNQLGGEVPIDQVNPVVPDSGQGEPPSELAPLPGGEGFMMLSMPAPEPEPKRVLEGVEDFNQAFHLNSGIMAPGTMAVRPAFPTGARAPVVGAHFGLNRAAVHVSPVTGLPVTLQAYDNMSAGDRIELFWHLAGQPNAIAVRTEVVSEEQAQAGANISSNVPIERAVIGFALWYVRVTRVASQNPEDSVKLTVFYKDALPGGPDRKPDEAWHSELHAAQLALPEALTPGLQIPVTLDPYPQMRVRDVITLSVGGIYFTHTLEEGEVDNPVSFLIDAGQLEPIKDLEVVHVVWRVHDEVENFSEKWSGVLELQPEFDDGSLLESPQVLIGDEVHEGQLWLDEVGARDARMQVYVMRPIIQLGDKLRFSYEITTVDGQRFTVTLPDIVIQRTVSEPYPGDRFGTIPNADLARAANGQLRVSYQVYRNGAMVWRSRRNTLTVQGRVQRLPAPGVVEAAGGLLPGNLAAITAAIAWPGMSLGDRAQLILSGSSATGVIERTVPLARVSQNEASLGRMERTVVDQFALLNGGNLRVSYEVGQTGAGGQASEALHLLVGEQVNLLPAPIVVGLDNGLLRPGGVATVNIPVLLQDDDRVTLSWSGRTAAATFTDVQVADAGVPMAFSVTAGVVEAGLRQAIQVFYTVRNGSGVRLSGTVTLIIASADTPWDKRPPVSLEAAGGLLDPARVPLTPGATFRVAYQGMLPLDQVRLLFDGDPGFKSEVQTVDQIGTLTFHVPRSVVLANIGKDVIVRYERRRHGQTDFAFSDPLRLKVNASMSIDTRTLVLNGVSVKLAGRPRTGLDSIGNTAVRTPTGGSGKYTYTPGPEGVVSVTAQGKVTGIKNGNTTISVTDGSSTVSYRVEVSNVFEAVVNETQMIPADFTRWANSVASAAPPGAASLLTDVMENDIRRVYSQPFTFHTWVYNRGPNGYEFWNYGPNLIHRWVPASSALIAKAYGVVFRRL
ncbi:Ig-like domain-containing protein [Pseudomonas entomophila]|uniref:Ig-like domain-containing protein n=1 Tax=Pseudomonas entomophila TaxID=312306 RepID=UPI001EFFE556|nr:Ig-like domain-containing protein [Pseudomonas entomophila]MCG8294757.1 Ig-like domain-containing protein [Pseudomonas entomophila]